MGLRAQLLVGLVIIICGATVTIGVVTVWAMRQQSTQLQIAHGRILGHALAAVLGPQLSESRQRGIKLQRIVSRITGSGVILHVDVVDPRARVLVSDRHRVGEQVVSRTVVQSLGTKEQMIQLTDKLAGISTPIIADGKLAGAVMLEVPLGSEEARWTVFFWFLMGIDGLLLLLFVGIFLTLYVIRPVELMQQAASRVTRGDLSVRLVEQGVRELSSLAVSFNSMTSSVQQQLERLEQQRQQLASSREQVIRSEKLASVGRLAAGVAHEVGNPLQSIIGFTEMLSRGGLEPAEQKDLLERVEREAQRIHRIIRELLDYARPVEDAIEPVDLHQVVQQALQLVGPQQKLRRVDLTCSGLEELPRVAATTQRLVQVLVNLLLNAADAMQGQGAIDILGACRPDDERIELHIRNTGPAISPEERQQIFDPFFSTKEPGEGTGLGLCVAQSIVESYGGQLSLADGPQTTFVVVLRSWQDEKGSA